MQEELGSKFLTAISRVPGFGREPGEDVIRNVQDPEKREILEKFC